MTTQHDLVLHVGMPRANALIEPALIRLRPQMRALGVAYVSGAQLERLRHASGWHGDRFVVRENGAAFRREVSRAVRAELEQAGSLWRRRPLAILISGDQLLGRGPIGPRDAEGLRPYAEAALRDVITALPVRSVRVILHTERQDRLVELAYLRQLAAGHSGALEQQLPYLLEPVLDYRDLLKRLGSVPQVTDVIVRPVEMADAGVPAFLNGVLDAVGLRDELSFDVLGPGPQTHPQVYSAQGAALARAMYPMVQGDEFFLVRQYLTDNYSAALEYGPPELLPTDVRARVLAAYSESNRTLFEQYMPDLLSDSYADDVTTFALGNVLDQPRRMERATRTKIKLAVCNRANRASRTGRRILRHIPEHSRTALDGVRRQLGIGALATASVLFHRRGSRQ